MSLPLFIARRYLFSRNSRSVINIISSVSVVAVGIPVAAMIVLLSVYNGFDSFIRGMYDRFDPDIEITPSKGKFFEEDAGWIGRIAGTEGVSAVSGALEESVLVDYRGTQSVVTVLGADSSFGDVVRIGELVAEGEYMLYCGEEPRVLAGRSLAYAMGINHALMEPLHMFAVNRSANFSSLLPLSAFRSEQIYPGGLFALDISVDGKYMIVPLEFIQKLTGNEGRCSKLLVRIAENADPESVKERIAGITGPDFEVRTRVEQRLSLYRILIFEKWGIFLIILLVMVIASFSVMGSLGMLIVDKRDDISTLGTMGAGVKLVRGIFLRQGMMIAWAGGAGGIALGLLVSLLQLRFGLVKMPSGTFLIENYPVLVRIADVALVILSFAAVGYGIVVLTVRKMIEKL